MSTPDAAREWTIDGDVRTTYTYDGRSVTDFRPPDEGWIGRVRHNWKEHVKNTPPYPGNFSGRGIVICGGGVEYLTCAWVSITMLRKLGCRLPIEVWYTDNEINREMMDALQELGAECRNVGDYMEKGRRIKGYALRPFAILNSRFKEILYLEPDNNCVADPSYLFDTGDFKKYGAVFWPGCRMIDKSNPIYTIVDYENYDSFEQESGQLLIDKERCWMELNLCLYFNLKPQTYHKLLPGDKDTFRFAWIALRTPFYMTDAPVGLCGFKEPGKGFCSTALVQHDAGGNILLLHRHSFRWASALDGEAVWTTIKRFRPGATDRFIVRRIVRRQDISLPFIDYEGDVEEIAFSDVLGEYELQCLDILKQIRNDDRYRRFMLHSYFCIVRDGYQAGFMQKIIETV